MIRIKAPCPEAFQNDQMIERIVSHVDMRTVLASVAAVWLASEPCQADPLVERGRALIEASCAACHAIAQSDESRHRDAPAFRTLWRRYPLESLEEALAEGIDSGHPDMPVFFADPGQIEAIIAYIASLPR